MWATGTFHFWADLFVNVLAGCVLESFSTAELQIKFPISPWSLCLLRRLNAALFTEPPIPINGVQTRQGSAAAIESANPRESDTRSPLVIHANPPTVGEKFTYTHVTLFIYHVVDFPRIWCCCTICWCEIADVCMYYLCFKFVNPTETFINYL